MLDQGVAILRESDESAYSIVPSRLSSATLDRNSQMTMESTEMTYRQLIMDDDLFTSRVYKRNYRNPRMLFEKKEHQPTDQDVLNSPYSVKSEHSEVTETVINPKRQRHIARMVALEPNGIISTVTVNEHASSRLARRKPVLMNSTVSGRVSLASSSTKEVSLFHDSTRSSALWEFLVSETTSADSLQTLKQVDELNRCIRTLPWTVEPVRYPYVSGPAATNTAFSLDGPAVSNDLRGGADLSAHPSIRLSVDYCRPGDLKTLLDLIGSGFPAWRKHYFLEACYQRRTALVKLLLGLDEGVNSDGHELAKGGGFADFIKVFLTWGIRNHTKIIEEHWLLHSAIMCNNEQVVEFLLGEGAQVDYVDKLGSRPIHLACISGNLRCVNLLVAAGTRVDCIDSKGRQPIHYLGTREATDSQDVPAILDVLLVAGANVAAETYEGQTLLQMACQHRKINALKAALLFGSSTYPSGASSIPLRLACQQGNIDLVQELLKYCRAVDVCEVGVSEESPLSLAIKYQCGTVVQKLIHKAIDLELSDERALQAIYQACKDHNLSAAEQLEDLEGPFILGNLVAGGPLLPLRKWSSSPWAPDEKCIHRYFRASY